jgi:diguanylate cyclase (GGDEF)-like protein/PAS domain S-box-containing protein
LEHYADDPEAAPFPMPQKSLARIADEVSRQDASVVEEEVFVVGEFVKRFRSIHVGLYDNNGEMTGLAAMYHDTTREHEANNRVAQMQERLHDITRLVSDWVWETDSKYRLVYVSPRITETLGLIPQKIVGSTFEELGTFVSGSSVRSASEGRFRDEPYEILDRQGQRRLFHVSGLPFYCTNTGTLLGVRGTAREVTERHKTEARMHRLAHYDRLTDLPNRALFRDQLAHLLSRAQAKGGILGLLYLDLDDFKEINDSFGYEIGDKLLEAVADNLRNHIRTNDIFGRRESEVIARLGGDEFTLILQDLKDVDGAATAAQRIISEISKPFYIDGHEIRISASIGIAIYREGEIDSEKLLKNADLALYQSKANGRGKYFFYNPDLNDEMQARKALERDLRSAIDRNEMHLCFHPLVDLSTGRVTGVEALLRWIHPERGEVRPDVFIPVAEATGVITRLGEWVMRTSCRQVKEWQQAGLAPVRVGINLSPVQFRRSDLPQVVKRVLHDTGLDPRWLEIEITEGTLMDDVDTVINTLQALRNLGVDLAIDDFGTGYSSLAYLQRFPVNRLKIDRSFVGNVCSDPGNAAITRAIVTLAHDLGMKVIAEGVENRGQFDFLKAEGCDEAQGFYFTQPLTTTEMTKWLTETGGKVL